MKFFIIDTKKNDFGIKSSIYQIDFNTMEDLIDWIMSINKPFDSIQFYKKLHWQDYDSFCIFRRDGRSIERKLNGEKIIYHKINKEESSIMVLKDDSESKVCLAEVKKFDNLKMFYDWIIENHKNGYNVSFIYNKHMALPVVSVEEKKEK